MSNPTREAQTVGDAKGVGEAGSLGVSGSPDKAVPGRRFAPGLTGGGVPAKLDRSVSVSAGEQPEQPVFRVGSRFLPVVVGGHG